MAEDWDRVAQTLGYINEQQMLIDFYENEEMSISTIAEKLGAGTATIVRRLAINGVDKRKRGGANNVAKYKMKFHRMDQRVVLLQPIPVVAKMTNAHHSTVYKYRRGVMQVKGITDKVNEKLAGEEPAFDESART